MGYTKEYESQSAWLDTEIMPVFPSLAGDLQVDVCIVGGGIGGLSTAYMLMKEGKKVCVLEAFELAGGQTARTTAHFSYALDNRYFDLEKYHGEKGIRLAAESHKAAMDKVEQIAREEKIDCELARIDGYLFSKDNPRADVLQQELEAAHRAGLSDVALVNHAPIESFDTGPCLFFPKQMQLHPLKYLAALTEKIVQGGGQIFTGTHVYEMQGGENAYAKTASGFTVRCKALVVATNSPINDFFAIHTKQAAYRTYAIAFQIPRGSIPMALYWDTLSPFHYIRLEKMASGAFDILIVGGEDHKTGQDDHPENCFTRLESWTRERFPMAMESLYKWSGQVMESVDGLAFLGRNPMDTDNVYVITGDSGNGLTHCTIGAMIITDQILGRTNSWEELYNPSRISLKATRQFLKENANVAVQYGDWFSAKPKPDFGDIDPGEGVVYRDGVTMIAAYKDEKGDVDLMSAVCPHLAGVVSWNGVEKSWDCPCHGSRFDCHGQVIEGPAIRGLKKFAAEKKTSASPPSSALGIDQLVLQP